MGAAIARSAERRCDAPTFPGAAAGDGGTPNGAGGGGEPEVPPPFRPGG